MGKFLSLVSLCVVSITFWFASCEDSDLSLTECDSEFERVVDAVYVINLDRSKDRLAYITALLAKECIQFKRFPAVDGFALRCINLSNGRNINIKNISKHTPERNPIRCVTICDVLKPPCNTCQIDTGWRKVVPGEIGCAMSHIAIWHEVASSNCMGALIFEDDVVLLPGFKKHVATLVKHLPEDADVLFLGILMFESKELYVNPDYILSTIAEVKNNELFVRLLPYDRLYSTCAYYITKKGAKKLANIKSSHHYPIDVSMIYTYRKVDNININVYESKKKIVYVNYRFPTTVRCK